MHLRASLLTLVVLLSAEASAQQALTLAAPKGLPEEVLYGIEWGSWRLRRSFIALPRNPVTDEIETDLSFYDDELEGAYDQMLLGDNSKIDSLSGVEPPFISKKAWYRNEVERIKDQIKWAGLLSYELSKNQNHNSEAIIRYSNYLTAFGYGDALLRWRAVKWLIDNRSVDQKQKRKLIKPLRRMVSVYKPRKNSYAICVASASARFKLYLLSVHRAQQAMREMQQAGVY